MSAAQFVREADPFPVADSEDALEQPFFGGFDRPIPQLVDIDGDGDLDLFVQEDDETVRYFENIGTPHSHVFRWRTDHFADLTAEWFYFVDLDADDDLDLIGGVNFNEIAFIENIGGSLSPDFTSVPQIVRDAGGVKLLSDPPMVPAVLDVDCNETLDLFLGQQDGTIEHYRQVPSAGSVPMFELVDDRFQNIEVAPAATTASKSSAPKPERHGANAQAFFDADLDGDIDLYYGDFFETSLLYFRNDGTCSNISMSRVADSLALGADSYFLTTGFNIPTPADLDGDGTTDLVVGTLNESVFNLVDNLFFLKNTSGSFTAADTGLVAGLDFGKLSAPAFGDVDRDGDRDIVVGTSIVNSSRGGLSWLERTGSEAAPSFTISDSDFLELATGFNYAPAFADIDADGDDDLFVGMFNGRIVHLEAIDQAPFYKIVSEFFADIDVGGNATPSFGDIDGDGDYDLLVGETTGIVNLFENTGTASHAVFTDWEQDFSGIDIGQSSRLHVFDWDGDTDLDLLIGGLYEGLMLAENTGSATAFLLADPTVVELDAGFEAAAALADIDGDGDADLVVGNTSGGLRFFWNALVESGIDESDSDNLLGESLIGSIYPNPVSSSRRLWLEPGKLVDPTVEVQVAITDLLGRLVLERMVDRFSGPVEVALPSSMASGAFLVTVSQASSGTTERMTTTRLVVLR